MRIDHPSIEQAAAFTFERWHQDIDLLTGYEDSEEWADEETTLGQYSRFDDLSAHQKEAWINVVKNVLRLAPK